MSIDHSTTHSYNWIIQGYFLCLFLFLNRLITSSLFASQFLCVDCCLFHTQFQGLLELSHSFKTISQPCDSVSAVSPVLIYPPSSALTVPQVKQQNSFSSTSRIFNIKLTQKDWRFWRAHQIFFLRLWSLYHILIVEVQKLKNRRYSWSSGK